MKADSAVLHRRDDSHQRRPATKKAHLVRLFRDVGDGTSASLAQQRFGLLALAVIAFDNDFLEDASRTL